jgi:hypothetical protein
MSTLFCVRALGQGIRGNHAMEEFNLQNCNYLGDEWGVGSRE